MRHSQSICYRCIYFVDAEDIGSHGGYPVCEYNTTPDSYDCRFRPGIPRAGYDERRSDNGLER